MRSLAVGVLSLGLLMALTASPAGAQEESDGSAAPGMLRMGGFLLFSDETGPLSHVVPAGRPAGAVDIGEVKARSCQHGVAVPITASLRPTTLSGSIGDGGYVKAMRELKKRRPELAGIYDVRVDVHMLAVLGFYRRQCVEIVARGFR